MTKIINELYVHINRKLGYNYNTCDSKSKRRV